MSSILHPLQTASQKLKPKHQVLILKCYPKYQKGVQEIKPNSSELSYLLYYASTRRTKLQKVGAFLQQKTDRDVPRQKLGNVQVTLQILTAIIEKTPRDLALYAGYVLAIIGTVIRSDEINMVEETLPTWEAYCKHVDEPSLSADKDRSKQYLDLIKIYANLSTRKDTAGGSGQAIPRSIRWRTVSLRAIRAIVGSDAIATNSSDQLKAVMPVILDNLSLNDGNILHSLQQKARVEEKQSTEMARKRRMSVTTVTTIDTNDGNPAQASETTADADKVAEEEVRVLAVRCLKQIFSISTSSTRGQTRVATTSVLRFISNKCRPTFVAEQHAPGSTDTWATSLIEAIARWTPVQDRFVIVVTAMETLIRYPIIEALLEKQLVLVNMIDHLLKSDINLIGLSVMDVLVSLIQHMLLLLQLGGRDSKAAPHSQQKDVSGLYSEAREIFDPTDVLEQNLNKTTSKDETVASPMRKELLVLLERCISDLGTHIYYADQISDMITAILARLKPSVQSDVASATAAVNDPVAASRAIAESASLQEDPLTDNFFSFATARAVALKAVKDIMITANNRKTAHGASGTARSRVGVQVWEGTQWLLKDEDQDVRFAYVDALVTWLKLETNKADSLLPKSGVRKPRSSSKRDDLQNADAKLAKRAVSNASKREVKPTKSTFYQLLHLALYDNALDFDENEPEILLLHTLLSNMVEKLGVNAITAGLPMIMTLQQSILHHDTDRPIGAKIRVASLVHGYFWSIIDRFDLESTRLGQEINSQISRRKQFSTWCDRIRFPSLPVDQIPRDIKQDVAHGLPAQTAVDGMKPFLDTPVLVNEIAEAYNSSLVTPPSSPPGSPGRMFSVPTLGFGYGYGAGPTARPSPNDEMPQKVKDEMCRQWSRENCIAAVEKEGTASVTGSRRAGSSRGQYLGVGAANGSISGRESPASNQDVVIQSMAIGSGLGSISKHKHPGWSGSALQLTNSSSRDSTMRVSDLKRALSGYRTDERNQSPLRRPMTASKRSLRDSDADSESLVSWNEADDNDNQAPTIDGALVLEDSNNISPHESRTGKHEEAQTYHDAATLGAPHAHGLGKDVPPVPKIPSTLNLPGTWPRESSPSHLATKKAAGTDEELNNSSKRVLGSSYASVKSMGKDSRFGSRPVSRAGGASIRRLQQPTYASSTITTTKAELAEFLAGIDSDTGHKINGDADGGNRDEVRNKIIVPPY